MRPRRNIAVLLLWKTFWLEHSVAFVISSRHCDRAGIVAASLIAVDAESVLDASLREKLDLLIQHRAQARWIGDYAKADELLHDITKLSLPSGLELVLQDLPRSHGGGCDWKLVCSPNAPVISPTNKGILSLAHAALGMAVTHSERGMAAPVNHLKSLVDQAKELLRVWKEVDQTLQRASSLGRPMDILESITETDVAAWSFVESGLRGRKPADAAFWFALAGAKDEELFHLLCQVCVKELKRFGMRDSCPAKSVWAIANRLAAAGVKDHSLLEQTLCECLRAKGDHSEKTETLDLHSDQCALMIWKFSTRQKKQRSILSIAAKHWERYTENDGTVPIPEMPNPYTIKNDYSTSFLDSSRPLVVDLGCGMGVSLLGLATCTSCEGIDVSWQECNFIGVDLGAVAIGYAKSLASRWRIDDRITFVVEEAEALLERLSTYPGRIAAILVQFPTPYRLSVDTNHKGNSQLPQSALDGFMVTERLLELARHRLTEQGDHGLLILQSNCEDVAVLMRNTAVHSAGFHVLNPTTSLLVASAEPTQRTSNWIAMGGERAVGFGWSAIPLLPRRGRTETEIACEINMTPVHRVVLQP